MELSKGLREGTTLVASQQKASQLGCSGISDEKQEGQFLQEASSARKTSISCIAGTQLPSLPQKGAAGF